MNADFDEMSDPVLAAAHGAIYPCDFQCDRCGRPLDLAKVVAAVRPLIEAEVRAQIADDIRRLGSGFRPDGLFEHGFSAGLYAAEQATRGE